MKVIAEFTEEESAGCSCCNEFREYEKIVEFEEDVNNEEANRESIIKHFKEMEEYRKYGKGYFKKELVRIIICKEIIEFED